MLKGYGKVIGCWLYNMKLSKTKIKINGKEVDEEFLFYNKSLTYFEANKLKTVGDCFLTCNQSLTHFEAKNLESVGNWFLYFHPKRKELCALPTLS